MVSFDSENVGKRTKQIKKFSVGQKITSFSLEAKVRDHTRSLCGHGWNVGPAVKLRVIALC